MAINNPETRESRLEDLKVSFRNLIKNVKVPKGSDVRSFFKEISDFLLKRKTSASENVKSLPAFHEISIMKEALLDLDTKMVNRLNILRRFLALDEVISSSGQGALITKMKTLYEAGNSTDVEIVDEETSVARAKLLGALRDRSEKLSSSFSIAEFDVSKETIGEEYEKNKHYAYIMATAFAAHSSFDDFKRLLIQTLEKYLSYDLDNPSSDDLKSYIIRLFSGEINYTEGSYDDFLKLVFENAKNSQLKTSKISLDGLLTDGLKDYVKTLVGLFPMLNGESETFLNFHFKMGLNESEYKRFKDEVLSIYAKELSVYFPNKETFSYLDWLTYVKKELGTGLEKDNKDLEPRFGSDEKSLEDDDFETEDNESIEQPLVETREPLQTTIDAERNENEYAHYLKDKVNEIYRPDHILQDSGNADLGEARKAYAKARRNVSKFRPVKFIKKLFGKNKEKSLDLAKNDYEAKRQNVLMSLLRERFAPKFDGDKFGLSDIPPNKKTACFKVCFGFLQS